MPSPFRNFVNAEITFLAVFNESENEVGNIEFSDLVEIATVTAYVKEAGKRPEKHKPPGIAETAIAYECIAVEPMVLPPEIKPLNKARATISGVPGELTLENGLINPPYGRQGVGAITEKSVGTKFFAWFVRDL